jgi:chromosome segregation ATPase
MGLFINNNNHPDVYKTKHKLNTPNQEVSRQDFLSDLMNEQQKANAALEKALSDLGLQTQLQEETQSTQWNNVGEQLNDLRNRLERYEKANHQLVLQMNEQLELQKEVAEKITKQEEFQGGVLQRLDTQEALMDKISRQINHIRSILFERTNYLATKIDDGYKLTSTYVYKLMTGSDQPLTFFLMNQRKEENQNQMD